MEPSAFISIISSKGPTTLQVTQRINKPVACQTIEFVGVPTDVGSPFSRGSTFTLLDRQFNGKDAWTNGVDYLSYAITTDDSSPYGTWLVGDTPGHDSGFAYLKPIHESLIPVEAESPQSQWNWLNKKGWEPYQNIRAECKDSIRIGDHFFRVEYIDKETGDSLISFFIPSFLPNGTSTSASGVETSPALWNVKSEAWENFPKGAKPQVIAAFGSPTLITDPKGKQTVGYLIQQERGAPTNSWRLFFKRVVESEEDEKASGWNGLEEVMVTIDSSGPLDGYSLTPIDTKEESIVGIPLQSSLEKTVATADKGDYIWLWYSLSPVDPNKNNGNNEQTSSLRNKGAVNLVLDASGSVSFEPVMKAQDVLRFGFGFGNNRAAPVEEITEMLLQCVAKTKDKIVFKFHFSDRRDVMKETILSRETVFFVATVDGEKLVSLTDHRGLNIIVHFATNFGSDLVTYIRHYLSYKDAQLPELSSCFLYHAAVTIPKPLVYAAEILCVLLGAKPLTMIQYTTNTDHQWKFPLVVELSRGALLAKQLLGDAANIEYRYHSHGHDETLILFHPNRSYVAEALVPYGISQALHPMPYPDTVNPKPDWKKQIYNAWWNGYMLGYPEQFISSYCETFHNGLGYDDKRLQIHDARREALAYMVRIQKPFARIGRGLENPVSDDVWRIIKDQM